eukprot:m.55856 g.55856  ORF g.55856 m.55856 type:complete len:98 (-) comp12975_c0_seq2:1190-1483(-)
MQAINAKPIELFHNDGAKKVLAASPLLPFRGPHQLFMTAVAKRRNQQATQMKKPFLGSQIESGCHARKEQRRVLVSDLYYHLHLLFPRSALTCIAPA